MIVVEDLHKTFRGAGDALSGVSFTVDAGEFVGYAGPNGAGKSTTVKILTGVLRPTSGAATVDGLVPWRHRRKLTLRTGVVFGQRTQLWWDLPVADSFELVRRLYRIGPADYARDRADLVERLGMGDYLDRPVRALSLGQRMRAELAVAVLPRPAVLFLDEPTIGLDVEAKATLRTFLVERNRTDGTTVLLTTHDTDDLVQLCRRLLIIDRGSLVVDSTVEALQASVGGRRRLVVDLAADVPLAVDGATTESSDGHRRVLSFSTDDVRTPELVARVLESVDVVDLTLEPPDLEQIIRDIYRRGHDGANTPPDR